MLTIAVNFIIAISLIICIFLIGVAVTYSVEAINPHNTLNAIKALAKVFFSITTLIALFWVLIVFLNSVAQ